MNPVLPAFPPFPEKPVVGTFHPRPCVRAHRFTGRIRWLPILGPFHSDWEHIGAVFQHVHVDYGRPTYGCGTRPIQGHHLPTTRPRWHASSGEIVMPECIQ